ncbi:hypothetical protein [Flectobacillus major]|uniref:hypothetical protein n=1 Tax=Flectobacillus major TaxID=103 RepID=UPI0004017950|nr:hypothetical protein [Flectobacillus major]
MIYLVLNPLSKGVAITEIIILLLLVAIIGFVIGHWVIQQKNTQLQILIKDKQSQLKACRGQKNSQNTPT